jgi:hypothetical protein
MTRVEPYHSNSPETHRKVHHTYTQCPEGEKIQPEHWERDTGGYPPCEWCLDHWKKRHPHRPFPG